MAIAEGLDDRPCPGTSRRSAKPLAGTVDPVLRRLDASPAAVPAARALLSPGPGMAGAVVVENSPAGAPLDLRLRIPRDIRQ